MAKYVLKIKGKSYGVKRWFTRSVTIQLGVMKYNNVSINLKEFEVVTDDDYKRGKYDYYFELREKISLIDKRHFTVVVSITFRFICLVSDSETRLSSS